ncbi:unnamed protein product [Prunus armeniaca]|uniref:Squalene monooxygenase n=1 Tax=Prunus armeniaca TaxID=36596 RepID=A0A6J5VR61_PRUAR|nr:unnamed protein product [Prunus armeniaca]
MIYEMLAAVMAFLLGFVSSYSLIGKKNARASAKNGNGNENSLKSCENGMCQPEIGASTDIIIVGSGVVGSALAYTLGKDGRRVHVIERDLTEPDRIVGELLQPGAYLRLIDLGLEDCVKEIDAQRVFGFSVYKDGKKTKLPYPLKNFHPDVVGMGFHHGRFIQRMLKKASNLPNVRLEQGTVTSLLDDNGNIKGMQYKCKGSHQEITAHAPLTIVCDGFHKQIMHVILADPSPIMFYPISSTEIHCLVDIPGQKVPYVSSGEMAYYLKTKVAPQVPPELYNAFLAATEKGNIKSMPNRSMPAASHPTLGALLMGDAVNMLHPITGGGMTAALSDVVVRNLLRFLRNLNDSPSLCKLLESFYTQRKQVAFTINTLAGAAYKVLCASPDPARKEMRQACFDYLSLGCTFSNGSLALLSGLKLCPLSLIFQVFVVGLYAVGRSLLPFPSPSRIWSVARMILGGLGIIFPIINAEGVRQMFCPVAALQSYLRGPPII